MRRREFVALLAAAAWPRAARAQQSATPEIGFLSGRSLASDSHLVASFRKGLSETGYVEGQNVAIEYRWAESRFDRLPAFAADLIGRHVAVIFVGGADVSVRTLRTAIPVTPTVFATDDPVELGLVASFNRPGGNATAVAVLTSALWPKRLELLHGLVVPATLIALLVNPDNPTAERIVKDVPPAAHALGLRTLVLTASNDHDIDSAFATLAQQQHVALLVQSDPLFNNRREKLVALAARQKVPAMYDRRDFPAADGLISYGASAVEQYRQSGIYVGRILKGEKPADLPVMQPTKFELVINLRTARALGLDVPDKLLALADEVIE